MKVSFATADNKQVSSWELNPSQQKFWDSQARYVLFSGGFGCGKSLMLVLKAIELSLKYPNNYILMGRRTYPELRDTLVKEFFTICPEFLIANYLKAEGRVIFKNKSEVIFRHLDTMAESEIRSMNLGTAFIDQAEDIPKEVFLALIGRLRRDGINDKDRRIYLSSNPKLTWLYADFKQSKNPDYELIEASTLENKNNLSPVYIDNLLKFPESWKKQYVYGIWDESLLSDRIVFAREHIEKISHYVQDPIRTYEGLDIFKEYDPQHRYQMGVDASEGIVDGDEASISIVDLIEEEEVASWAGRVPPDVLAEYVSRFVRIFQDENNKCVVVVEMNSIGLAVIAKLKLDHTLRLYRRQEFDKISGKITEKLGWRTTAATKPLLVSRFQELLRLRNPKIRSRYTFEQFKSFVWTDEARKHGMGAETNFHDDRLISILLAFWQRGDVKSSVITSPSSRENNAKPRLKIINGRIMKMPQLDSKIPIFNF